jgi:hypothetical protein
VKEVILEDEVVAIDSQTSVLFRFQELMHRQRKHKVQEGMKGYLSTFLKAAVAKEAKITVEITRASKSVTKCVKFPVIIKALKASTA